MLVLLILLSVFTVVAFATLVGISLYDKGWQEGFDAAQDIWRH